MSVQTDSSPLVPWVVAVRNERSPGTGLDREGLAAEPFPEIGSVFGGRLGNGDVVQLISKLGDFTTKTKQLGLVRGRDSEVSDPGAGRAAG